MNKILKGYNNSYGYMGYVYWIGDYMLFACERDYVDYIEAHEDES